MNGFDPLPTFSQARQHPELLTAALSSPIIHPDGTLTVLWEGDPGTAVPKCITEWLATPQPLEQIPGTFIWGTDLSAPPLPRTICSYVRVMAEGKMLPSPRHHPDLRGPDLPPLLSLSFEQTTLEEDETALVTLQNVVEQACNYFLDHAEFPTIYEQMQAMPLLSVGMLTYAGDDGGAKGQAYRFSVDLAAGQAYLRFRFPDETGRWQWRAEPVRITLPDCVLTRLKQGSPMAPTLRELVNADGSRIAVLDVIVQVPKAPLADWKSVVRVLGFDWGVNTLITAVVLRVNPAEPEEPVQISRPLFVNTGGLDGQQTRTRRQIDELKAARDRLAQGDAKRDVYEREIMRCWRVYEARNRELAHLAVNLLLLFASVWGCSLISGESLKTLKSTGRGKGVRGRWRNWRNTTTIRSEIWHILRYKSHLLGIRFRSERPRGTSHTCPRCGRPAQTYRSSRMHHRSEPVKWGRWLVCAHCAFNGDRDYCAAVNIARLGVAFLVHMQATGKAQAFSVTDQRSVKPVPYIATGAVLLFPPHIQTTRLLEAGKIYINGWKKSATIRSSYATPLILRLCG